MAKTKYIIPPGLLSDVQKFEAHCKVAADEPIIVVGPTGVGKSLFLNIFEKLHKKDHVNQPVRWANCAHFGGSDPNIARSELFGQIKGAFTGAVPKKGLVEEASGGVLILEEIGELPLEVQAMLLTFIETGQYRQVGAITEKQARVQIVGATNREGALREDFRYRFFPFYVPALHQRRIDVLYYLADCFPSLLLSLKPWEIMLLLAHNWPGNVREVLRVGRLIERDTLFEKEQQRMYDSVAREEKKPFPISMRFYLIDKRLSALDAFSVVNLYNDLEEHGIDVQLLESLLNKFRLGLSVENNKMAFPNKKDEEFYRDELVMAKYEISAPIVPAFSEVRRGLVLFCDLFGKDPFGDTNLLEVKNPRESDQDVITVRAKLLPLSSYLDSKVNPRHLKLEKALFKYVYGLEVPKSWKEIPTNSQHEEILPFLQSLKKMPRKDRSQVEMAGSEDVTWEEMERRYCARLLQTTSTDKEAAERAGLKYSTFRDKLQRLGISRNTK